MGAVLTCAPSLLGGVRVMYVRMWQILGCGRDAVSGIERECGAGEGSEGGTALGNACDCAVSSRME